MYNFNKDKLLERLSHSDMKEIVNDFDTLARGDFLEDNCKLLQAIKIVKDQLSSEDSYIQLQNGSRLAMQIANCCMRELLRAKL